MRKIYKKKVQNFTTLIEKQSRAGKWTLFGIYFQAIKAQWHTRLLAGSPGHRKRGRSRPLSKLLARICLPAPGLTFLSPLTPWTLVSCSAAANGARKGSDDYSDNIEFAGDILRLQQKQNESRLSLLMRRLSLSLISLSHNKSFGFCKRRKPETDRLRAEEACSAFISIWL